MKCFYKNSLSTIELSEFFFLNVKKSRGSQFLALVYIGMVFRFVFENKQTNVFLQEMVCQQCLLFSSKTRNIVPFFFNLKEMFFFFFDRHAEAILDFALSYLLLALFQTNSQLLCTQKIHLPKMKTYEKNSLTSQQIVLSEAKRKKETAF